MPAELGQDLVVDRELVSADRTPVRGVERQDDWLPPEVAKRYRTIGGRIERKVRCRCAGWERPRRRERTAHALPRCRSRSIDSSTRSRYAATGSPDARAGGTNAGSSGSLDPSRLTIKSPPCDSTASSNRSTASSKSASSSSSSWG